MEEKFLHINDVLSKKIKKVALRGWIKRRRDQKEKTFVILRDVSGEIQIVFNNNFNNQLKGVGIESSIKVWGEVKEDKRAPGGKEIIAEKLEVVCATDIFPIGKDLSEDFLLDVRHLWLRSSKMVNILKIRDGAFRAAREFFHKEGFYEVTAPMFVGQVGEEGGTLFELDYFGRKAYLTQTGQLHLEAAIFALEKVYSFGPSFRAEKSRTKRHLTEYWHLEGEMAWYEHKDNMALQERLIKYISEYIYKNYKKELKALGKDPEDIKKVILNKKFKVITYKEALKILNENGLKLKFGDDLGTEGERLLAKKLGPIFIEKYPKKMKAFYMKEDPNNPELVLCSDLIMPGVGEVIGSSERETDYNKLLQRIKDTGDDPKKYEWYLDLRKYGSIPHSGFGVGMARLIMVLTGIEHIRDVIPFPRTITRLFP